MRFASLTTGAVFSALLALAPALVAGAPLRVPTCWRAPAVCNGHAELCDRSYGNVTYFGAHDSFTYSSDPLARA
jgi:hypothetical protein